MMGRWKRLWCLHYWVESYLSNIHYPYADRYECKKCGKTGYWSDRPLNPPEDW